ncbi:hypothetical protein BP5796_08853 [Coleophoma crateriformis]|uniref:NAD-dependent epimerase/dehydratase domain-containing protein n=1 Tax=Coleophoma crateriformis TaxID=565419 RepID=A0A3D8R2I8_9HELO|nr:hypothetical protein BP5796_08853 [Coleophoma crateriformis]
MPHTLVTGANGFVAAHIIDQLVALGHSITGSVRSTSKGQQILDKHPEYKSKVKFVVVSDFTKPGTWDSAFQEADIDYVIHTAAPLLDDPTNTDFDKDFLKPSVHGMTELLQSASKFGKNVKCVVVTGSINAVTTGQDIETRKFNSSEWLPVSIEDARQAQNPYISYCVAKAEAEKALWSYVTTNKPTYSVVVLLPALIFGPPIQPFSSLKKINFSTDQLYSLFNGTYQVLPPTAFPSYIDVRDLATAHISSLTTPAVANKRFLIGGLPFSNKMVIDVLSEMKEFQGKLPEDSGEKVGKVNFTDVAEWNEALGLNLRTPYQTFGETALFLQNLETEMEH